LAEVVARHGLSPAEREALGEGLYAYNKRATGHHDGRDLGFVVEEDGTLVAGLEGYTWGGICEVARLWVREDRRKQGLGSALVRAAIAEAEARGCAQVLLSTYDFQAPDFYARHGFEKIAEIPDKPVGHTEFVMRKVLPPPAR
jgi:ribosomal protein S18 acetylase RimI-like enzyme